MSMDHDPPTTYRGIIKEPIDRITSSPWFWAAMLPFNFLGALVKLLEGANIWFLYHFGMCIAAAWLFAHYKWGDRE